MAKTCFNKTLGDFDIAWPNKIARHDLVYKAPPSDPMQYGMPIGNGDIGALLWCDDHRIIIALNKCDLWDDAAFGPFQNWSPEEEEFSTTLRHGCRIIIDFGVPLFDTFYLNDFNGRLHLKNGCIELETDTPFGKLKLEAFITYNGSVLCTRVETDFAEDCDLTVTLERYGSRTFSHWYRWWKRDASLGLTGTEAFVQDGHLLVSHQLTTGEFVCALRPEGEGLNAARKTSHVATAKSNVCPKTLTFFATITSPLEEREDTAFALKVLEDASTRGFDSLLAESEACWKAFWSRSFVETDDDYLDNLWHLTMYYANAGQRGKYPGRFINSLWSWSRDVQNWNFYFHWNQQEVYWGLNAAGHHDLCTSYLDYRFNSMEHAAKSCEDLFGIKNGLFVSDVCERRGYNSSHERLNHTPVGEIALDFWRQYQYTCDKQFLKERALPYLQGAARFFVTLFRKEEDGFYHAPSGTAYEGWDLFYDPITELAMAKSLFSALLEALAITGVQDENAALYRDVLDNLVPIKLLESDERIVGKDNVIRAGMFKGRAVDTNKVVSIGKVDIHPKDNPFVHPRDINWQIAEYLGNYMPQYIYNEKSMNDTSNPQDVNNKFINAVDQFDGVDALRDAMHGNAIANSLKDELYGPFFAHPQANVAPVFPMNAVGLKDKGTELFDALATTALTSRDRQLTGWDPMPIVVARLGLVDATDEYLYNFPSIWQYYNNGFSHYGPNLSMVPDMVAPFRHMMVSDVDTDDDRRPVETFPFRHMGLEPHGVFAATMNERLLQSFDGTVRIAPTYGKRDARFKLHAVGGFEVMCEVKDGTPAFVAIRSIAGNPLTLENPWATAYLDGKAITGATITMDTVKGEVYVFTPDADTALEFEQEVPAANEAVKSRLDNRAQLGLARAF